MVAFFTDTMICGFSLYQILAYFLVYSCIGWCLEVVYAAVSTGQLVNRGFLNGPVCPIYGFGMIIVLFLLTPLQHSLLLLYIGGVILPSTLELAGGWALYKLYHTRWWDYSDYPFNIGGYICLEFSLLWGVGTLVVMRIVHPVVADLVDLIPPFVGVILMCFLYAVYAVDVVATAIAASALADTLDTMEQLGDSIHAVSDAMTQLLGTTTLTADKKLDEGRLQFKLAAAEARDAAGKRPSARDTMAAIRAKAAEATEAARRASEDARLNAAEAANAARLAAKGTAERAAELLQLEQLAAELQARSEEMQAQLLRTPPSWARAVCCVPTRSSGTAASCAVCPHCGRCCTAPNRKTRTTTRIPNDPECHTGAAVCGIFVALRSNNVVKKCEKTISKRLKPCYTDYKVYKPTAIGLSVLKLSKL